MSALTNLPNENLPTCRMKSCQLAEQILANLPNRAGQLGKVWEKMFSVYEYYRTRYPPFCAQKTSSHQPQRASRSIRGKVFLVGCLSRPANAILEPVWQNIRVLHHRILQRPSSGRFFCAHFIYSLNPLFSRGLRRKEMIFFEANGLPPFPPCNPL